ncbi:MAG: hypothetical protein AB1668_02895 [Nanoarchaeota archaeon]
MVVSDAVSTSVGMFIDYALIIVVIMIIWYIFKFFFIAPPPTKEEREKELSEQRKFLGDWWRGREEKSKAAAAAEARKKEEQKAKHEQEEKEEHDKRAKEKAISKRRETVDGVKGFVLEAERSADKAIESLRDGKVKDLQRNIESITRRLQSARRGVTALLHNVEREHKDYFRKMSAYIMQMQNFSEEIGKNVSAKGRFDLGKIENDLHRIINGCGYLHSRIDEFINGEIKNMAAFAPGGHQ